MQLHTIICPILVKKLHSFIVCLRLFNTLSAFCRQNCICSFYFGGRSNHERRSPFCILAKPVCERAGNIGFGGEAFIVEFIAVSVGAQEFSNQHFRLYILAFDLASRSYRDSCVFLWNVRLPFSKSRYCSFFCLDAKETKDQGKPDRSARFSLPSLGKSL